MLKNDVSIYFIVEFIWPISLTVYTMRQGRFPLLSNILLLDFPTKNSHFLIVYQYYYFVVL